MRNALSLLAAVVLPCALGAQTTFPTPPGGARPAPSLRDYLAPKVSAPVDRVVAVVGDQLILHSDVTTEINRRRAEMPPPTDSAGLAALERQMLEEMVNAELLVQKAVAEKIEVPAADIEPRVDAQIAEIRRRFSTDAEFREALKGAGMGTFEEYRRSQIEDARRRQLQQEVIRKLKADGRAAAGPVSEAEITALFEENRASLPTRPATISFRQIVVPPRPTEKSRAAARARADSLYTELTKGKGDFEQIAKRSSMDAASKDIGGDLGWVRRGINLPEFDQIIFNIRPGIVSLPFETAYGFHIVRVDRVQPGEVKVRQILVKPALDSADVARARVEADSVLTAWQGGAAYDVLSGRHHDRVEEKNVPDLNRDSLPASYRAAIGEKAQGAFAGPFAVADASNGTSKYVVLEITNSSPGGPVTLAEFRNRIRDQLALEKLSKSVITQLRKEMYVSIRL
jgi:peptidyl-prolyl cis-trans isomerase SurA